MYDLTIHRGVMCHENGEWYKNWSYWNWATKLKLSYKSTEELSFMTLKRYTNFEEKLTCGSQKDLRNLANFNHSTWKCQNLDFDGILLSKVEKGMTLILQRSYLSWQWRIMQNWKRNWLVISKLTEEFNKFWLEHSKI